jgi:hypothetical protein
MAAHVAGALAFALGSIAYLWARRTARRVLDAPTEEERNAHA